MLHLFAWGFRVSSMKIRQFQAGREWGEQIEKKKNCENHVRGGEREGLSTLIKSLAQAK